MRSKTVHTELTQRQEWQLMLGGDPGAFDSPEAERRAWFAHRHELLPPNRGTRWYGEERWGDEGDNGV